MSTATIPVIPDSAPFTPAQKAWLNGFLAGVFSRGPAGAPAGGAAKPAALKPLTLLFASQTGTAERLAKKASKAAGKRGFAPTLLDAAQAKAGQLTNAGPVLFVTSTYGDGEAPDSAKALLKELKAASGSLLAGLKFSVCSIGDSNYAKFCQAGKDFDERFESLGGKRLIERVDCDVGQEDKFTAWLDANLAAIGETGSSASEPVTPAEAEEEEEGHRTASARVVEVRRVSGESSAKEVNHVAFSLEGTGLSYEAGDALSVMPDNESALVSEILAALGCDGEESVKLQGSALSLRRALTEKLDLGKAPAALNTLLGVAPSAEASASTARSSTVFHVIDALLAPGAKRPDAAAFVAALRPLQPRLYSISSSPLQHKGEVHLTVGAVRYEASGRKRNGVASTFLADRASMLGKVSISVHKNTGFRLPSNGDTPVIMVGPGTGIAPFRAFINERLASGAKGPNWLFFGDQREASDFLYRDELTPLAEGGALRLSLAWSRDQAAKIYVQDRMMEAASELWSWMEMGAHVYICGDASRMAKDVDSALRRIVMQVGGRDETQAAAYIDALVASKRYQRDVY